MEKEIRNITLVEARARNIRIQHGLTQKEFGRIFINRTHQYNL